MNRVSRNKYYYVMWRKSRAAFKRCVTEKTERPPALWLTFAWIKHSEVTR